MDKTPLMAARAHRYADDVTVHPYLDAIHPIAIAHRGGAGEAPENTIQAFQAAHDLGYRYIETDAQLTYDGVVVAFHDNRIDRVSGESGKIQEWRWKDLRNIAINGAGHLSTISELLSQFPTTRFNFDAKSDQVLEPLLADIERAGAFDRVCIGSFFERRLRRARKLQGTRLCTSFGPGAIVDLVARSRGIKRPLGRGFAAQAPATFRGITVINRKFVEQAHADGVVVHAWTIDDPSEMNRLLDLGVDGIMTDRPTVLRTVLESRGMW